MPTLSLQIDSRERVDACRHGLRGGRDAEPRQARLLPAPAIRRRREANRSHHRAPGIAHRRGDAAAAHRELLEVVAHARLAHGVQVALDVAAADEGARGERPEVPLPEVVVDRLVRAAARSTLPSADAWATRLNPTSRPPTCTRLRSLHHLRDRDLAAAEEREIGVLLRLDRQPLDRGPEGAHHVEALLEDAGEGGGLATQPEAAVAEPDDVASVLQGVEHPVAGAEADPELLRDRLGRDRPREPAIASSTSRARLTELRESFDSGSRRGPPPAARRRASRPCPLRSQPPAGRRTLATIVASIRRRPEPGQFSACRSIRPPRGGRGARGTEARPPATASGGSRVPQRRR